MLLYRYLSMIGFSERLGWFMDVFAKSYPLDWWSSMKVRTTVGGFEI